MAITAVLFWALGPLLHAKFYVPLVLALLGLCAWFCFRQLKLTPPACLLGALAAVLNGIFFSAACWGVGQQILLAGMTYLAIGLLADADPSRRWIKVVLAGFAVGMGVMEGFDMGVLDSLMVAAFVVFAALANEGAAGSRVLAGVGRLSVVALAAGLLAFQAVTGLVATQIQGVTGTEQDTRTRLERWDFAFGVGQAKRLSRSDHTLSDSATKLADGSSPDRNLFLEWCCAIHRARNLVDRFQ